MNLSLKQNGLRFLDSRAGDILIADPRLNVSLLFPVEFLDKAKEDPQKMMVMGRKLLDFLARHEEARWRAVKNELVTITDEVFKAKIQNYILADTIDALRKCEKELYFFRKKNERNS